ncbi:MAG: phosphatidate cytidylyltransferase [Candidatus Latescibacterota bacterium]|jgi:phosphatidate cytidylyltransferase
MSNLVQRVLAAALFGPTLLALFWYGGIPLLLAIGLIVAIGTREFCQMLGAKELHPWTTLAILASLLWCGLAFIYGLNIWSAFFPPLFLILLIIALFKGETGWRLANMGGTLLAILYVGLLGSFVILVRNQPTPNSHLLTVLILSGIWASDVAAYFSGRTFGRWHPFPNISPGKTEAGFIGGTIAAVAAIAWGTQAWALLPLNQGLMLGLIIGIGAPVGDLIESMIKRDMGVKDTSALIPGHGGILDRFDSVFFVFPLVYLYLQIITP